MLLATCLALALVFVCLTMILRQRSNTSILAGLGAREPQIDGLRGICALLVAAHHAVFVLEMVENGGWQIAPADHVLQTMGKSAVAFFFLICAYLFWGKEANSTHQPALRHVGHFVGNRLARLVPAYLFAMIFTMVFIGLGAQGFVLHQSYGATLIQIARSLTFSFFGTPNFNRSLFAGVAIYVSWSLYYEWLFYAALPFVRLMRLRRVWALALPALIVLNVISWHLPWIEYFAYGAIAYEVSRWPRLRVRLASAPGSFVSVALFVGTNVLATEDNLSSGLAPALLAAAFLPIAAGASWAGLLRTPAARFTGAVSYSLYLLNTPIILMISAVLYPREHGVMASAATETVYLLGAVAVAAMSYLFVERPFLPRGSKHDRPGGTPALAGQTAAPASA